MIVDEIREQWKRRQNWHRAEKSLTLQSKALCRRLVDGDKVEADKLYKRAISGVDGELEMIAYAAMMPLVSARDGIEKARKEVEKRLVHLAEKLPAFAFVEETPGFGALGFAGIVGEAGVIGEYTSRRAFQKRMGLGVIDGERQRRVTGEAALLHGYNPARRSLVWTIGDSLFKAQSQKVDKETGEVLKPAGKYRVAYDQRKEFELDRAPEMSKAHAHNRAKRYMESKLLSDLYYAWRKHDGLAISCFRSNNTDATHQLIAAE